MADRLTRMRAKSIDTDLRSLAQEIDQFNEMVSRNKPMLDFDLIEAAQAVTAARAIIMKYAAKGE